MSRNFSIQPTVRFNRSKLDLSHNIKTSANVGELFPVECIEVLPGDTFKSKYTFLARVTSSFIKPVMDNLFIDTYAFFVPLRLCYDKYERVFGNPKPSAYEDNALEEIPHHDTAQIVTANSIAHHLDLPVGAIPKGLDTVKFRAFALIYERWFRNENTVDETRIHFGDDVSLEQLNGDPFSPQNYTGMCPKVGKKKDYFTSALPSPQKGAPVEVPFLLPTSNGLAPVTLQGDGELGGAFGKFDTGVLNNSLGFQDGIGHFYPFNSSSIAFHDDIQSRDRQSLYAVNGSSSTMVSPGKLAFERNNDVYIYPYNNDMVVGKADVGSIAKPVTVNDWRFAFQMQKMLERDALFGSRYNEYLLGHFGVSSPDARLQIPEFLGGSRIPINIYQVAQTSASTSDSPMANVSGYSISNGSLRYTKGFTEHGFVLTVACIRQIHTYSQGIHPSWFRHKREDFYDPLFATLGEQPIYQSEIFAKNQEEMKSNVFGYKPAWDEYRFLQDKVTGQLDPNVQDSLDIWHFGDKFENAPVISKEFTEETSVNVDRTLSLTSQAVPNFIFDIYNKLYSIRVMPAFGEPGLIDHH